MVPEIKRLVPIAGDEKRVIREVIMDNTRYGFMRVTSNEPLGNHFHLVDEVFIVLLGEGKLVTQDLNNPNDSKVEQPIEGFSAFVMPANVAHAIWFDDASVKEPAEIVTWAIGPFEATSHPLI